MLLRVGDEVDVEGADPLLEDSPHRLPEVGNHPHQREPGEPIGAGCAGDAVIGGQQRRILLRAELVVDAEVAEVEERIAHARILPVHDPDPCSVIDEIGCEQVVVARAQLHRRR
jgi:hypothetical protein